MPPSRPTSGTSWPSWYCAKCLAQSGVFHGRHRDGLGLTRPGEPSSARRLLETSEAPPDGRERRDLLPVAPLDRAFVDGRGTGPPSLAMYWFSLPALTRARVWGIKDRQL